MQTITLPAVCDRSAARLLLPELTAAVHQGGVAIDGRGVERIGQAGLQLLLSAIVTARAISHRLTIDMSDTMRETAHLAGLETHLSTGSSHDQ
jgi:anti-anti-sigma regulatory factor